MKILLVASIFAAACVVCAAGGVVRAQGAAKTTWDGVYANDQARAGETLYADKCAECHAADQTGGFGPPLVGPVFVSTWGDMALSDLFDSIKNTAPASNPGSLSRDDVADVMAYLLQVNGFPAGSAALPNAPELLKPIRIAFASPAATPR